MRKALMILEVSRKQDYIFGSKRLRENAARSMDIRAVTESEFFRKNAGELYSDAQNLVYSGGGHTILQFDDAESADAFARRISRAALEQYDGMELYVKRIAYSEAMSPTENLHALIAALEEKKALRRSAFRRGSIGVEALDSENLRPVALERRGSAGRRWPVAPKDGFSYAPDLEKLAGDDNFIAVVHIDGNAMGARVAAVQGKYTGDWDACRSGMQRFSAGVQRDFEAAFRGMAGALARKLQLKSGELPLNPIILAGDDVCFVTRGKFGLELAAIFLEKLAARKNEEDGRPYAACAGVALVHSKYPFHRAYELAEELCSSAKKYGVSLSPDGSVSAMDWHIEYGQLLGGLTDIRENYLTGDGNRLELRPVAVLAPKGVGNPYRRYDYIARMAAQFAESSANVARGKLKELRTALKQGEVETEFYLRQKEISDLLYAPFRAKYGEKDRFDSYRRTLQTGKRENRAAFQKIDGAKRCVFFDAIEISDHFDPIREVTA